MTRKPTFLPSPPGRPTHTPSGVPILTEVVDVLCGRCGQPLGTAQLRYAANGLRVLPDMMHAGPCPLSPNDISPGRD